MVEVYSKKELDPQKRAAGDLETVIQDEIISEQHTQPQTSFDEERSAKRVATVVERTSARLLIFTTDSAAYDSNTDTHETLKALALLFAEVHVVVLNTQKGGIKKPIRPTPNFWLYGTNSRYTLDTIHDALKLTSEQFEFAGDFRADIVMAFDAFSAGVAAVQIGKKYHRPVQIHVTHDIYNKIFLQNQKHAWLKKLMAWWVFRSAPSVRVTTKPIANSLLHEHSSLKNRVEIIPQYIDLQLYDSAYRPHSKTLKERFPQYSFFTVFIGPLTLKSGALEALSASVRLLQYPSICLVYLGDGPAKKDIIKRAEALGVTEKVIISPQAIDEAEVLKEAQLLLYTGGEDADERVLLKAAAAGVPIITAQSSFVDELFVDGESAFICPAGDTTCIQNKANIILNENVYRNKFARNAREIVLSEIEQDVEKYKYAFKDSIERALLSFETSDSESGVINK